MHHKTEAPATSETVGKKCLQIACPTKTKLTIEPFIFKVGFVLEHKFVIRKIPSKQIEKYHGMFFGSPGKYLKTSFHSTVPFETPGI